MTYAIGAPGGTVRIYIDAPREKAERQLQPGEVLAEVAAPAGPAIMGDGAIAAITPPAPTLADTEAALLDAIDAAREAAQMTALTAGGAKKYVYNRKAVEAIEARGLAVTVLNALSLIDRQRRFPFAQAEAVLTGEPLSIVLARYEAGLTVSAGKVAAIEAKAMRAKRAVRAAPTVAGKRAAAVVDWTAA